MKKINRLFIITILSLLFVSITSLAAAYGKEFNASIDVKEIGLY